jgi:hypothetical protein
MRDQSQHAPTSVERQRAKRTIDAAVESTRKRQPNDRHALRCVSLYVDLEDSGTNWLRPVETTSEVSRNAVEDAIGDYALEFDHLTNESLWPALKVHHPHLHIEAMIRAKAKNVSRSRIKFRPFGRNCPTRSVRPSNRLRG